MKVLATLKPTDKDKVNYNPALYIDVYLQTKVSNGKCTFAYSTNGKSFKAVGDELTMKEGKWVGAKVGLVASQPIDIKGNKGYLDIDWFRITK